MMTEAEWRSLSRGDPPELIPGLLAENARRLLDYPERLVLLQDLPRRTANVRNGDLALEDDVVSISTIIVSSSDKIPVLAGTRAGYCERSYRPPDTGHKQMGIVKTAGLITGLTLATLTTGFVMQTPPATPALTAGDLNPRYNDHGTTHDTAALCAIMAHAVVENATQTDNIQLVRKAQAAKNIAMNEKGDIDISAVARYLTKYPEALAALPARCERFFQ